MTPVISAATPPHRNRLEHRAKSHELEAVEEQQEPDEEEDRRGDRDAKHVHPQNLERDHGFVVGPRPGAKDTAWPTEIIRSRADNVVIEMSSCAPAS